MSLLGLRTWLLWRLDRFFPPDQSSFMTDEEQTSHEVAKASGSMGAYLSELGRSDVDVLDFGCGWGGETLWLADRVRRAAGVDVAEGSIAQAQAALRRSGAANCRFLHSPDGRLPFADESFDAVFSSDTMEHVMDLDLAFSEIRRVLRPGGSFISRFGPLFHSPRGYHLFWACRVPWAHVIFGLEPILELRRVRSGTRSSARTWEDTGLNGKRFRDYRMAADRARFEIVRFDPVPVRRLEWISRVPLVANYAIFGVDLHLKRPPVSRRGA